MSMNNNAEGFFAGRRAFNLIASTANLKVEPNQRDITYNGFRITLDEHLNENDVIGIGEPYAIIAKKMNDHFNAPFTS